MFLVDVKELSKSFGSVRAVDSVSLQLKEGELFGLLGPNGSGKTTIIKCLTGQVRPDAGSVSVSGLDVFKERVRVRGVVGIIPEQESPPSFLTAEEYLFFAAKVRRMKDFKGAIDHWFDFLEFSDQRKVLCKDLSRGTRQKLMFAQGFLHDPSLAFIDEPLVNLDPLIQKKMKDFLKKRVKEGKTVFLSTHSLEIAKELCTRLCILKQGKIVYSGKPKRNMEGFFLKLVKNG
ncbi:ABC transporter ATP-binding protein [Candidatus Woesearchaeota archaeon]|nr:ABC transporter ATP-binding protein [Candidatus Woesearchaeota archaeon]